MPQELNVDQLALYQECPFTLVRFEAYGAGDRAAFDKLVALVYPQLRAVARRQLAGRSRPPVSSMRRTFG